MRNRSDPSWKRRVAGLLAAVLTSLPTVLLAQGGELSKAARETTVPGGTLALVSYMALWAMLFGYVVYLARQQAQLDTSLEELEGRIDEVFGEAANYDDTE